MTSKIVDDVTKLFVTFEKSEHTAERALESPVHTRPPLVKTRSISSPDGLMFDSPSPLKG